MTQAIRLSPAQLARLAPTGINLAARERWPQIAARWATDVIAAVCVLIVLPVGCTTTAYLFLP